MGGTTCYYMSTVNLSVCTSTDFLGENIMVMKNACVDIYHGQINFYSLRGDLLR